MNAPLLAVAESNLRHASVPGSGRALCSARVAVSVEYGHANGTSYPLRALPAAAAPAFDDGHCLVGDGVECLHCDRMLRAHA